MHVHLRLCLALLAFASLASPRVARAQQSDLGHKTLGTLGLLAGSQPQPGVYIANRFVYYTANKLVDRDGNSLPVGLDIDAFADALGLGATFPLRPLAATWTGSIGIPVISSSAETEQPQASLDRSGLGDLFVEPLRLGWRLPPFDLVTGYGFYAPTGRFEPGGSDGVGRGHWTHQFSLGGTAYFGRTRIGNVSALASFDLNQQKRDIDITRGDTIQIQGGLGLRLDFGVLLGVAGYALWQVRDDRGSDLPPVLAGARDRAFGLGPELSLTIAPIRSQLTLRYEHDVAVTSRPLGQVFFVSLSFAAWRPRPAAPTAP